MLNTTSTSYSSDSALLQYREPAVLYFYRSEHCPRSYSLYRTRAFVIAIESVRHSDHSLYQSYPCYESMYRCGVLILVPLSKPSHSSPRLLNHGGYYLGAHYVQDRA